ncbi:hypothetical protein SAMN06269185_2905 [Natronoarchaeum philippinense]|uniref:DUF8056 domain-containing protein n=1 Tax=Natronoarchaeum philippinense TaxID=558529 RepID=A0A285P605_NATPI|nr:hypothetical protein [Natronoarchaeum philippinense]SNZ17165.1 hypothetical protein SAMN06269185_2905 [Natronoarchaeum philippinense]
MTDGGATHGTDSDAASEDSRPTSYSALRRALGRARRESDSRLLRSYVWVSALIGLLLVITVILALPVWIAQTIGHSALNKISRGVLPVIVLGLLVPLFAPVVYAARNHRRGTATGRSDAALGVAGYLYVLSIYLALVISAPTEFQTEPTGALAPVIDVLYGLPALSSVLAPILGALVIALVQRFSR